MIESHPSDLQTVNLENPVALEAVSRLFQALRQHGVRYCHWKSNLRLKQSMLGQTDLDLLLDCEQTSIFKRILDEQNIKPVLAAPGKRYPAIEDYLGFDPASNKLFHLHVHYRLILGEQFVKNYHLPLESRFLSSIQLLYGVKIPTPELELIVLSIRALLKYRDRDAIKDVLSVRSPGLPAHIRNEIKHLLDQTSMERIAHTLGEVEQIIPSGVVLEFLRTVVDSPRAGYTFYRLRKQTRQALSLYQRYNRFQAACKYFQEMWWRRKSFLRYTRRRNMTLLKGGMMLALIGADGAGKSTQSQTLAQWLGWKLDVVVYYMGSKHPSRLSKLLYLLFRITRRGYWVISRLLGEKNLLASLMKTLSQSLLYSHSLSIGYDRYRRYLLGKKKAGAGYLVIFDRFPLEGPLDGPQIHVSTNGRMGSIANLFSRAERKIYSKIRPPDCFIVLDVSPQVSLQRKPDHKREAIEVKNRLLNQIMAKNRPQAMSSRLICVDANLPLEQVLGQIKKKVWEIL